MKVTNFYDNKNQYIIEGEKGIYFQSYESIVAKIEKNGILKLGTNWDFSKTTLKYLYKFIEENKNKLCDCLYNDLKNLTDVKNKKNYIQKLLNDGIIEEIEM